MSAKHELVKTVFDIQMGNGRWLQFVADNERYGTGYSSNKQPLTSLFRYMGEELQLEELEHGIDEVKISRFASRQGHRLQFNPVMDKWSSYDRKINLLTELSHFLLTHRDRNITQDLCFDYELPEQEWYDQDLVSQLGKACQMWATREGFPQLTINVLSEPYQPPEVGEVQSILVRFFKRPEFSVYRTEQLTDVKARFHEFIKAALQAYQANDPTTLRVVFEITPAEYDYLTALDLSNWTYSAAPIAHTPLALCQLVAHHAIQWPGGESPAVDNRLVIKVIIKE